MWDPSIITASDVEAWLHCRRIPYLRGLRPELSAPPTTYGAHLIERRVEHRQRVGQRMGAQVWVDRRHERLDAAASETAELIRQGIPVIGTPALLWRDADHALLSTPDFLIRGPHGYSPREVTLAHSVRRPEHVYRLRFHAEVIARSTGTSPASGSMALFDESIVEVPLPPTKDLSAEIDEVRRNRRESAWPLVPYSHHKCGGCRFLSPCLQRFEEAHDVSLVYDVNSTAWRALRERGLVRYDDLASTQLDQLGKVRGLAPQRLPRTIAQARSLVTGKPTLLSAAALPDDVAFLDLEGDPDENVDYLWGLLDGGVYTPLISQPPAGDREVFAAFLRHCEALLTRRPGLRLVHYGSYEPLEFRRYAQRYSAPPRLAETIERAFFDLHSEVRKTLVAPVTSYGLKAIAQSFGFRWRVHGSSASWSIARYRAWRQSGDPSIRSEIERYNEDDVRATELVFEVLRAGPQALAAT